MKTIPLSYEKRKHAGRLRRDRNSFRAWELNSKMRLIVQEEAGRAFTWLDKISIQAGCLNREGLLKTVRNARKSTTAIAIQRYKPYRHGPQTALNRPKEGARRGDQRPGWFICPMKRTLPLISSACKTQFSFHLLKLLVILTTTGQGEIITNIQLTHTH